tara:strand:- start:2210 stop:2353 length:144 start_codon:yes stop_codon:yes gene_type:complete
MINPNKEESTSDIILRNIRSKMNNLTRKARKIVENIGVTLAIIMNFL